MWSDSDGSSRTGGRHPPASAPAPFGGGAAPSARVAGPGDGDTRALRLVALGLVAGHAASAQEPNTGSWHAQAALDDIAAAHAAGEVYDSVDALAGAMRAQLGVLAGSSEFLPWARAGTTRP